MRLVASSAVFGISACVVLFVCLFAMSSSAIPGGRTPMQVDDPEVLALAKLGSDSIIAREDANGDAGLRLKRIHRASRQVVAGLKYYVRVEMESNVDGVGGLYDVELFRGFDGETEVTAVRLVPSNNIRIQPVEQHSDTEFMAQ